MTDHRRRAEDIVGELLKIEAQTNNPFLIAQAAVERINSALKEVEEETFARAVEVVEKACRDSNPDYAKGLVSKELSALREEAVKK